MPLNTTDAELRAAAAANLAEKLKLERRQIIELRELFTNMSADMAAFVAETGNAPNAAIYEDELRGILAKQGRRVSNAFSGQIVDFLEDAPEDEDSIVALAAIAAVSGLTAAQIIDSMRNSVRRQSQAFVAEQVTSDTRIITATNQREMNAAVASSRASIIDDGRVPTNAEVGRQSAKDFKIRGFARSPTIAATYTQKIAEGVKKIEFDEFSGTRNGIPAIVAGVEQAEEVEIWVTVGDEKVRPSHIAADFTESDNGGWIVQGEFLRFPGDPFRGSPSNIINCRCSVQPVIE